MRPAKSRHTLPQRSSTRTPSHPGEPGTVTDGPTATTRCGRPPVTWTTGDGTTVYCQAPAQSTATRNSNVSLMKVWARLPGLPPEVSPSVNVTVSP